MAMWGVDSGSCAENLLSPLGLISYGGGTLNSKMSYIIHSKSKNNNFRYEIECDKLENNIKNVEKIYKIYLRKEKLEKLSKIK